MDTQSAPGINKPPIVERPIISPESIPKFSRATVECAIQTDTGEVYGIVYYQDPETKEAVFLPLSLQPVENKDAIALKENLPFFNPENPILSVKKRELLLYNLAMALLFCNAPIITLVDRIFNSRVSVISESSTIPETYKINVAVAGIAQSGKTTFVQAVQNLGLKLIKVVDLDPAKTLAARVIAKQSGDKKYQHIRGSRKQEKEKTSLGAIKETLSSLDPLEAKIVLSDTGGFNLKFREITPKAVIALATELIILTGPPNADQDTIQQMILGNPGLALLGYKNNIGLPPDTETSVRETVDILNSPKMQQFATHQRLQFALAIMELVTDPWYKIKILEALRLATPQIIKKYTQGLEPQLNADLEKISRLQILQPTNIIYII
ncbi:MAG TPA: hypothetical protein PLL26_01655 [Candidatus Dojkabacteria bacterium]|nr:hypothetical protein [Candidatus Dojkabacteria bacterium]